MAFGGSAVVERDVEPEHQILGGGDIGTGAGCGHERVAGLAALRLALAQQQKRLGRLHIIIERTSRLLLHRGKNRIGKFLFENGLGLVVFRRVALLHDHGRKKRPGLKICGIGVGHLSETALGSGEIVLHHGGHGELYVGALARAGSLGRLLEEAERLVAVAVHKLETHHADERVMVGRVLLENRLVDAARLGVVVLARVERGHHVHEHRALVGGDEVDRALDLHERVAGTSGARPGVAETDKHVGIADVTVIVAETPDMITAVLVVDDGLEHAFEFVALGERLRVLGAGHADFVEKRRNVVAVDLVKNELVHRESLVILLLILKIDAAVVRHESEMAADRVAHALDGAVGLAAAVAAPVSRHFQQTVELLPGAPVRNALFIGAEEDELGNRLQTGRVPEIGSAVNDDILGDGRIGGEPILHERKHAQREREGKRVVFGSADAGRLDRLAELGEIGLVKIARKRHDVKFLTIALGRQTEMVVKNAVGYDPFASVHFRKHLLRNLVGESTAVTLESEEVPDAGHDQHERENASGGNAHHVAAVQPPVRNQVACGKRRECARGDRKYAVRLHERRGRKRSGDRQNRDERHRSMEEPLHQTGLFVISFLARKHRRHKRQRREDGDEQPTGRRVIFLELLEESAQQFRHFKIEDGRRDGKRHKPGECKEHDCKIRTDAATSLRNHDGVNEKRQHCDEKRRIAGSERGHHAHEHRQEKHHRLRGDDHRQRRQQRQERPAEIEHPRLKMRGGLAHRRSEHKDDRGDQTCRQRKLALPAL